MSNVIQLAAFRRKTRQTYFAKYGSRLDRFIQRFVQSHIEIGFGEVTRGYQDGCAATSASWDYVQFREVLVEALDEVFGMTLYQMLVREPWFDEKLITKDEIVERCLRAYVMGPSEDAVLIGK